MNEINTELLSACKAALKCIARLTPFPTGKDEILDQAINETAEYADTVREQLRRVIEKAERQS